MILKETAEDWSLTVIQPTFHFLIWNTILIIIQEKRFLGARITSSLWQDANSFHIKLLKITVEHFLHLGVQCGTLRKFLFFSTSLKAFLYCNVLQYSCLRNCLLNEVRDWRRLSPFLRDHTYKIHLLTGNGLPPGDSSTVHVYTQTINRTTENKQYTEQHNNLLFIAFTSPHWFSLY